MFWRQLFTNQFVKDLFWSIIILFSLYGLTHNPIVRPVPQQIPGNWSIQLMQHPLLFGLAGHNYLALRDQNGAITSELHGLATDITTNTWKYVGTRPTDKLQVWEFENSKYYLAGKSFPGILLAEGTQEDMKTLWNKALSCKDPINSKNISYPPYGFSLRNETNNSNSVAYTLALCMELDARRIGLITPGWKINLLSTDNR